MFLKTCFKKSRPIFSLFISFILILGFLNYKVIQIHPFQIWGMFSRPIHEKNIFNCYIIRINDKMLPLYEFKNRSKVSYINPTINKYVQLKHREDPFKSSSLRISKKYNLHIENVINEVFSKRNCVNNYPNWLYNYMQQFHQEEIKKYEVVEVSLKYNNEGEIVKVSEQQIIKFNKK